MWLDGWTALHRVLTPPTRLNASAGRHPMTDGTEGGQSISWASPLSECRAYPKRSQMALGLKGRGIRFKAVPTPTMSGGINSSVLGTAAGHFLLLGHQRLSFHLLFACFPDSPYSPPRDLYFAC